jgi:hypothetical protein
MLWLYLSATVFGGGLVGLSALGHHDDHHGALEDVGLFALLSLRTVAWAALTFGGVGLLGVFTQRSTTVTLASAAIAGLAAWFGVYVLFRYLRRSEAGDLPGDATVFDLPAQLVTPFNSDGLATISFLAGGQVRELPARCAADDDAWLPDAGGACRIESIDHGVAVIRSPVR